MALANSSTLAMMYLSAQTPPRRNTSSTQFWSCSSRVTPTAGIGPWPTAAAGPLSDSLPERAPPSGLPAAAPAASRSLSLLSLLGLNPSVLAILQRRAPPRADGAQIQGTGTQEHAHRRTGRRLRP